MGAVEQAFPESIDEVLAMVKETPRGRWFIENYEKRLRSNETERILSSIAKLESHIQSVSTGDHDHALLQKAREAIAAARRDIAAIEQKPAELSAEGQLFAKLAALSKQSFSGPPAVSKGVERALRLVSDLDQQLSPAPGNVTEMAPAKPADLFKADEAIFEPAPPATPLVSTRRNESAEVMPRGAKLVIQHKSAQPKSEAAFSAPLPILEKAETPSPAPGATARAEPFAPPPMAPVPAIEPASTPDSTELAHSRIVIIRRKAEDLENLPLLDAAPDSTVSAA